MPKNGCQRPTDRLNVALANIAQAAEWLEQEVGAKEQNSFRRLIADALDEAHAALVDIREAASSI